MSTETTTPAIDPQERADFQAALRHALDGTPLEPDVARRIRERSARATEEIRHLHGELDEETVNQLLRDVRDES